MEGYPPAYIYSAKADYTYPLSAGARFETGVKTSYISTDNKADYDVTIDGITTPDYDKTNHFIYHENINAAYLSFRNEMGKISLQAGLRLENTVMRGEQLSNAVKQDSAFKKELYQPVPYFLPFL